MYTLLIYSRERGNTISNGGTNMCNLNVYIIYLYPSIDQTSISNAALILILTSISNIVQ